MTEKIDARGLSCPQPVILTDKKMKELRKGVFEVLVDTDTSMENISRLASQSGWSVDVKRVDDEFHLLLKRD